MKKKHFLSVFMLFLVITINAIDNITGYAAITSKHNTHTKLFDSSLHTSYTYVDSISWNTSGTKSETITLNFSDNPTVKELVFDLGFYYGDYGVFLTVDSTYVEGFESDWGNRTEVIVPINKTNVKVIKIDIYVSEGAGPRSDSTQYQLNVKEITVNGTVNFDPIIITSQNNTHTNLLDSNLTTGYTYFDTEGWSTQGFNHDVITLDFSNSPISIGDLKFHLGYYFGDYHVHLMVDGEPIDAFQNLTENQTEVIVPVNKINVNKIKIDIKVTIGGGPGIDSEQYKLTINEISIIKHNPVFAHYPLDSIPIDIGPNSLNGVDVYDVDYNKNGKINSAAHFDGQGDRIKINDYAAFNQLGDSFTISAWIKPSESIENSTIISKVNPNRDFVIKLNYDRLHFHMTNDSADYSHHIVRADYNIPINQWSHIAVIWSDPTVKMFINGEKVYQGISEIIKPLWSSTELHIGSLNTVELFRGYIDDLKVFNYELTDNTIKDIYEQPTGP